MVMASLSIDTRIRVNDGALIPLLGLGVASSSACTKACLSAFEQGYRQIDTAQIYGTEEAVGVCQLTCIMDASDGSRQL